ncbi:hypothetical protein PISMIDRAFT_677967 [Pisolithus microcarpus 441]|uniref:Uncharacterized protein n=1 Tax=Pisolithus microcarpus 441 TaxID=765257 RepID=A0A0C9ZFV6_9AGAM|nr:hypothetical protein PISMIDRAFT_677967 [Pisolithus microcarpus 441]
MNTLVAHTSLKRSPRARARKSSLCSQRRTRPPPLQIIPELSEDEFEVSPPPSRTPTQPSLVVSQPPNESPRVTLSAYTFSIDDAFLMFRDESPGSPTLSASSSSASSEDVPTTPGASDDEGSLKLPSPRVNPRCVTIRPLCISKPRSFMSLAEEDLEIFDKETTPRVSSFPARQLVECLNPCLRRENVVDDDYDFYAHEFQDFISFYSESSQTPAPRPDSIILASEATPLGVETLVSKRCGRSRFSKPLPLLPPPTPPITTVPSELASFSGRIAARNSLVRRKRNTPPLPNYPPPPPPTIESRPPPRVSVPADISTVDLVDDLGVSSKPPIVLEQVWFDEEDEDSMLHMTSKALSEAALSDTVHDLPSQPRKSTDSDAPCSSIESDTSSQSAEAHSPISPFSFPSTPSSSSHNDECESGISPVLRSRWSTSTLGSVVEPSRTGTTTLLSPFKTVFGGRSRRAINSNLVSRSPPSSGSRSHIRSPSKLPLNMNVFPTTPSPPSTPDRYVRRRGSRSSTSSTGTSRWSECESCESGGSLASGLRRKPIPVEMFLRV